jgi:hypothetical protein
LACVLFDIILPSVLGVYHMLFIKTGSTSYWSIFENLFGLSDNSVLHAMLWYFVSGSYWNCKNLSICLQ